MAKPIDLVTELHGEDAIRFVKEQKNPSPNPKRDAFIKEAQKLKIK